jgi:hypothetical protein
MSHISPPIGEFGKYTQLVKMTSSTPCKRKFYKELGDRIASILAFSRFCSEPLLPDWRDIIRMGVLYCTGNDREKSDRKASKKGRSPLMHECGLLLEG